MTVTDPDAVEQLCEAHCFSGLRWQLTEDGEFSLWGYEAFRIFAHREFLWQLAEYIDEGDELDIQSVGFIKYRHPVHACRYVVRPGELLHANLSGLDSLERGGPTATVGRAESAHVGEMPVRTQPLGGVDSLLRRGRGAR